MEDSDHWINKHCWLLPLKSCDTGFQAHWWVISLFSFSGWLVWAGCWSCSSFHHSCQWWLSELHVHPKLSTFWWNSNLSCSSFTPACWVCDASPQWLMGSWSSWLELWPMRFHLTPLTHVWGTVYLTLLHLPYWALEVSITSHLLMHYSKRWMTVLSSYFYNVHMKLTATFVNHASNLWYPLQWFSEETHNAYSIGCNSLPEVCT